MEASKSGQLKDVDVLVRQGADINGKGNLLSDWMTPLQLAAYNDHIEVVSYLLDKGAKVNIKGAYGTSALYLAAEKGYLEITKMLIEHGAKINIRSFMNRNALHAAAISGHVDIIAYLVEQGADIDAQAYEGWTPLHLAVNHGNASAVRLLLALGAETTIKLTNGRTPIEIAKSKGYKKIARMLREAEQYGDRITATIKFDSPVTTKITRITTSGDYRPSSGSWEKVGATINNKVTAFIDIKSIEIMTTDIIKLWVKLKNLEPIPFAADPSKETTFTLTHLIVDCNKRNTTIFEDVRYFSNGTHLVWFSRQPGNPRNDDQVVTQSHNKASLGWSIQQMACGLLPKL